MSLTAIIVGSVVTAVCLGCYLFQQYSHHKTRLKLQKCCFDEHYIKEITERSYNHAWRSADKIRASIILGKIRNPRSMVISKADAK